MQYTGEHLLIGKIGNLFVVLSFVFAIVSSISYYFASRNENIPSWKQLARLAFRIHSLSVFGIVVVLFIMLFNHYFEYEYVWHHSNREMQMKYILSCFWEGQEGSFLLWSFWHVILGLILQRTSKNWEAPVMTIISAVQIFLASMLLGIYVIDYKIGSNPFTVLLREHPDYINIPMFQNANYLEKLDGRGLNPLLQNYWMVIHPPTLFLGFALTVVPFAYALAGLWRKQFTEWIKPALSWTFAGVAILGIGILMGGAWAYEALSFGGFWAWDPVENASLVPWLTLVGGAHIMLISNKNKIPNYIGFFLIIISFILILYSTFLTRSGILGETSVHAFTDLGMSGQLLIYLFFFLFLGFLLLLIDKKLKTYYTVISVLCGLLWFIFILTDISKTYLFVFWLTTSLAFLIIGNFKYFPKQKEEDNIWSREFWMFVGAVVLMISSFQIIFYTSMPVWNKLFDLNKAPIKDVISFYNNWQLPFATIVAILIAIGQYFKYKKTDFNFFAKKILLSLIIAVITTVFFIYLLNYDNFFYILLLFASIFSAAANFDYFIRILKGKIKHAGASIAHIGFGLLLLGALISTSKKEIISQNTSGKDIKSLGDDFSNNDNILLQQGDTLLMGNYYVTYTGKRFEGVNIYFDVDYFSKKQNGTFEKAFTLSPRVQTNPRMGNVAEPDTRHFLTKDIYTHVTYADLERLSEKNSNPDEYTESKPYQIDRGDTVFSSNAIIVLDSLTTNADLNIKTIDTSEIAIKAHFTVNGINKKYQAESIYLIKENKLHIIDAEIKDLGLKLSFTDVNPQKKGIQISVSEKKNNIKDFIVMQAIIFPYINILWIGCILMFIGTVLAVIERIMKRKNNSD